MSKKQQLGKIALLFVLMSVFVSGFVSCSETEAPIDPYKRTLTATNTPSSDVLLGEKAVFEITAEDFSSGQQQISCTFNESMVQVWVEGSQMASGHRLPMSVNGRTIRVEVKPLTDGPIEVMLNVTDGSVNTSHKLSFQATEKVYRVELKGVPEMYMGLRRSIDMYVTDPSKPDLITVNYLVSAKVIKGKGIIHILDEMVWNDTIPDFTPTASVVKNSKWAMMYTGFQQGENQLEFTVQDSDGKTSKSVATIDIKPSEFAFDTINKTPTKVIDRNELYRVHFMIDDKDNYSNQFFARCYFTKGKGSIGVSQHILSEDPDDLKPFNRSQLCQIEPETEGDIQAVIEIHDLYGTVHSQTVDFKVNGDNYNIDYKFDVDQWTHVQKPFEFTISGSTDPLNKYQFSAELTEGSVQDATMELDAKDILGKGFQDILPHETLYVRFTNPGTYKMKLMFQDKWSHPKEQAVTFIVTDNPLSVAFSEDQHDAVLGSNKDYAQWTSTMSITLGEGTETYKGAALKYTNTEGKGVLKVNNAELVSGSSCNLDSKTATFLYTPSAVGQHTLTFLYTLADGRTATKTATVNVKYSPVRLNLVCATGTMYEGESREISILTSQAGYPGDMKYKFEFLEGKGQINGPGGSKLSEGTSYTVAQKVTERMAYSTSDGYTGPVKIRYTITGGDKMTTTGTASFTVEPGLSVTVATPSGVKMGTPANIEVKASKPGYTGKLNVKYEIQKPFPSYVGSGTVAGMTEGVAIEMTNNTQTLVFTPTSAGKVQILVTVTDDAGKSVSQPITFTIALLPLVVNPSPIVYDWMNGQDTFTITVPEGNGSTSYQVSHTQFSGTSTIIFVDENRVWTPNTPKTLPPGTYQLRIENMVFNENTVLTFTLIDGGTGEIIDTKAKVRS